jgi:hypothetical protein
MNFLLTSNKKNNNSNNIEKIATVINKKTLKLNKIVSLNFIEEKCQQIPMM